MLQQPVTMTRGHAPFVHLGDIHQLAAAKLGFQCSIGEAAELLTILPDLRVEIESVLGKSRVYTSADAAAPANKG